MARTKRTAQQSYDPTANGSGAPCTTWASLENELRRPNIHSTTATSTEVTTTTTSTHITTKTTTTVMTITVVPIKPAARPRQTAVVQSPTSGVFTVPEMTEAILNSGISQKQLLVLQRVNKYFKAIIERSHRLRKTMFLATVHRVKKAPEAGQISVNPLLYDGIRGDPLYDLFDIIVKTQEWLHPQKNLGLHLILRAKPKTLPDFRKARKRFLDSTATGRVAKSTIANVRTRVFYSAKLEIGGERVYASDWRCVPSQGGCGSLGALANALKSDRELFQGLEEEWGDWESNEDWVGSAIESEGSSEDSEWSDGG
ncbi:hypothetical protein B0A48_02682 [Cryoendolithus antarcticus]|uniref:Uncharacterized protein n=1 Tax=Cryoendolithus antarcticus TaxID=1507870 RepID=A0A1V8TKY1_9PEZI|nr:hypothetical protein B0A48_02682 [Cryoendolithus antarcticus]